MTGLDIQLKYEYIVQESLEKYVLTTSESTSVTDTTVLVKWKHFEIFKITSIIMKIVSIYR